MNTSDFIHGFQLMKEAQPDTEALYIVFKLIDDGNYQEFASA
jgi:hypothetical protein